MFILFEVLYTFGYLLYCYIESLIRLFVPVKKKSLAGKTVLITGAGHGIGRALAHQFSSVGAKLLLLDIRKDSVEDVVREIKENGGNANSYLCDVSKIDQIKSVADKVRREVGDIDVLVNNAGILHITSLLTLTEEEIRRTFDINILAYFWTTRQFLPAMINRNSGHIVNVASMAAKKGTAYLTDYAATKYGVYGFTEALKDEMRVEGHDGINFTTVLPIFVNTNMTKDAVIRDRIGRSMLTPETVATAVVDGVQRNQTTVFIPANLGFLTAISVFFPRRFIEYPTELIDIGFESRK